MADMTERYPQDSDAHLDGNALAGPLSEIFAVDLTVAAGRCANCGRTGPVAALHVYVRAPGLVGRCPGCDAVMLRLVRAPAGVGRASNGTDGADAYARDTDTAWLDLRGTACLQIPVPPA
ncbi:MAG TPA: DUF6510 family protein [Streptosporangiaceae bacterium]|nr:DUF6510 family protein [Streptosporangiaceae bacterium]